MESAFITVFREALRQYVQQEHEGIVSRAERALGLSAGSGLLHKWLRGERIPSLLQAAPLFDVLDIQFYTHAQIPAGETPASVSFATLRTLENTVASLQAQWEEVSRERDELSNQLKELRTKK